MTKKITRMLTFLCTLIFLACQKTNRDSEVQNQKADSPLQKKITIGYSIDTLAIERWRRDSDVFLNTAKELNAEVIVQNAGNKIDVQINQIEYLINNKVDVLVIVPKKADSLTEIIKKARSQGIPVISYDRLILNSDISLYMTVDSEKVGRLMAENVLKIRPFGNWYCFYGPEEDFNMTLIQKGINSVIAGKPMAISYVFHTDGWNYDLSYAKAAELLKNGKVPDAFICGNDAVAESVIRAISEYQSGRQIPVAGQDADIIACQNIIKGKQYLSIYKPITKLAEKTARAAVALSQGCPAEDIANSEKTIDNGYAQIPTVWLDPVAITKENIDEVIIKSGFHSRDEIYRE